MFAMRGSGSRSRWTTAATIVATLVVAACGAFGDATDGATSSGDAGTPSDGAADGVSPDGASAGDEGTPVAKCNEQKFGTPFLFPATSPLLSARLGVDEVLYVSRAGGNSTLGTTKFLDGGIDTVALIVQPPGDDEQAMLSGDGLGIVFQSKRANLAGPYKLWFATRANPGAELVPMGELPFEVSLGTEAELQDPWLTPQRLYFTLAATSGSPTTRLEVGELDPGSNTVKNVRDAFSSAQPSARHPVLSHDELELFYSDGKQVLRSTRPSLNDPFKAGVAVPELVGSAAAPTWISADDCDLYYLAAGAVGAGLFRASRR
jgi:hypothetical protein